MANGNSDQLDTTATADASPTPPSSLAATERPGGDVGSSTEFQDSTEADPYVAAANQQLLRHEQRETEDKDYYANALKLREQLANQIRATALPQPPQHLLIPEPPTQQELAQQASQRNSVGSILGQAFIIAGIASAVFGRHRNPWANAMVWGGVGSFIEGFVKGQKEVATQQLQNWNQSVEYAQKRNEEADKEYKNILDNEKLDFDQKFKLVGNLSRLNGDLQVYKAAISQDLNGLMTAMANHKSANDVWLRSQLHINSQAVLQWLGDQFGNSWSQEVIKKTGRNPNNSNDDFIAGMHQVPISQWIANHTGAKGEFKQTAEDKAAAKPDADAAFGRDLSAMFGVELAKKIKGALASDELERGTVSPATKTVTEGGFLGIGGTQKVVPDPDSPPVWKADPNGNRYSYGADDEAKAKNAIEAKKLQPFLDRYNRLQSGEATPTKENLQTVPVEQVSGLSVGTIFRGTDGRKYRVDGQNPTNLSILPE